MPKSMIDAQGEVRELSETEMPQFRPAAQVLPVSLQNKLKSRGPQKMPTKERITIRLSPEVVQPFRATGNGWQTRMDDALKDWLSSHSPAKP